MKAEELFVGALVRVNCDGLCIKKDTIVEVRAVDADDKLKEKGLIGSAHCRPLDDNQFDGGIWCEYLEPIPLTSKILEKNGFKFESPCINDNKDAWVYEWPHEKPNYVPHSFCLMSHHNKKKFPNFWIYAPNNPEIVYVHQLQHALRLCQIEKEIKL